MKTLLSILFFVSISLASFSQSQEFVKPNIKQIEKLMKADQKPFNALLKRLLDFDTTLTDADLRYLYYSSVFYSKDSKSELSSTLQDSMRALRKIKDKTPAQLASYLTLTRQSFLNDPFTLRKKFSYAFAMKESGQADAGKKLKELAYKQVDMIMATGDGLSDSTGWFVIEVSDEYDMLNVMGLDFVGQQSLTHHPCDYLKIGENKEKIEGVYFDGSILFDVVYKRMFKN